MVLLFKPIFKNTIWGGSRLHSIYQFPCGDQTGEAWGISAHPNGQSAVKSGMFANLTLGELWIRYKGLFGNHPSEEFPILVKMIDATDDLSIQVHPNDEQAKPYHAFGKKECWYILDAMKYGEIIIGHHAQTKEELFHLVHGNKYQVLLQRVPIRKGDFFFIDSGTIHAICKGTMLLEVQQSSDLTFRLYDYGRLYEGMLRELHVNEALAVAKAPDNIVHHEIVDAPFQVEIEEVASSIKRTNRKYGTFFVVLEGHCDLNNTVLKLGEFGFVSAEEKNIFVRGTCKIAWIHLV